jgi:hypothetical protein
MVVAISEKSYVAITRIHLRKMITMRLQRPF